MDKFIILADITCDLSEDLRRQFGVEDYLRGHIHFSDGRDFPTTLDWSNISRAEFYKILGGKKIEVNTAPPSPEEYYLAFKAYVEQGYQVLSMSISSKISSTYNVACGAADRVRAEFPDCNIYCFDSLRMSGAFGLLVIYAHALKAEGKSFDEIIAWLENNKNNVHQMGPIDDLIVVARRGRISIGKAIMGNFAGVKPMGDCTSDGYVSVLGKVKGIDRALNVTAQYISETAVDLADQYVIIAHTDREAYAEKLKSLLESQTDVKQVFVCDVFSGCGTNIGPGMVGAYFLGNPISDDLTVEKDTMNKLLSR
ncbi:MAG: DegV family protein [Clostridia bacterium]|nr:DegV family protein [Clostridia bacterium]